MSTINTPREPKPSYLVPLTRDLVTVGLLGLLLLCIHELATPFFRGFQCDDDTIWYPHKNSTVPSSVCYMVGMGVNFVFVLILEYQVLLNEAPANQDRERTLDSSFMRQYMRRVYCRTLIWLFGAISSELLTDISKFTAGRLRPHFIDVCRPMIRVEGGKLPYDQYCSQAGHRYEYVTNYYCTGDPSMQRDARLSFMSGHSSFSAYSAASAVFYLQSAMDISKFGLIKPALQVLLASTAFYTGLTRVSDYKHHWQDVLAGLTQGTSMAAVVYLCLWPSIYKTCSSYLKFSAQKIDGSHQSEELNRISY